MQVKKSGALPRFAVMISVIIALILGTSLSIASANTDEVVEETPIVATAQATEETPSVVEVQGGKGKGDKPEPKPTKPATPKTKVKTEVVEGDWVFTADCVSDQWVKTREVKTYDVTYTKDGNGTWVETSRVLKDSKVETDSVGMTEDDVAQHCAPPIEPTPDPDPKPDPKSGEDVVASDPVCRPEGGGTVTITTTSWTQDWVLVDGKWVLDAKVYGEPVDTTREATEEECPAPKPTPTPTETEDPVDPPVTGDLLVECTADNRLSMTNSHTWHALVIAGFYDENGTEVPLTYDVDVYAGTTEYVDITKVPSGTEVFYLITWMDLEGDSESFSTRGTITCGTVEPTPDPDPKPDPKSGEDVVASSLQCLPQGGGVVTTTTVAWTQDWVKDSSGKWVLGDKVYGDPVDTTREATEEECPAPKPTPTPPEKPTPSPTDKPTPPEKPTPSPTDKPTPTERPTDKPTEKPAPKPTDSPAPNKAKGTKSDDRIGAPKTGVADDGVDIGAIAGLGLVVAAAAAAITRKRRRN